jgi:RHS repeat-associated protein
LGNVLSTITDKKIYYDADTDSIADFSIPELASQQDYYPFGMSMPERSLSLSNYRFGFNGKEKDDEVKGVGNSIDMIGRVLDTRLGRTPTPDPEAKLFPGTSPYAFTENNPINAIDPNGHVVIFINGMHNGFQGGKSSYWGGVDDKIMSRIGDHHAVYKDGSSGGVFNTLFYGGSMSSNLNPMARMLSGYKEGKVHAADIIASLKRDPNDPNKITESIKVITHSMGTAYSRGYTAALEGYVDEYNKEHKDAPLSGFQIETQVDIAGFQGGGLPADKNVKNPLYMSGDDDDVANGKGKLKGLSPSSDIPGAKKIPTDKGATHSITDYKKDSYINKIPESNQNSDINKKEED